MNFFYWKIIKIFQPPFSQNFIFGQKDRFIFLIPSYIFTTLNNYILSDGWVFKSDTYTVLDLWSWPVFLAPCMSLWPARQHVLLDHCERPSHLFSFVETYRGLIYTWSRKNVHYNEFVHVHETNNLITFQRFWDCCSPVCSMKYIGFKLFASIAEDTDTVSVRHRL